MQVSLADFDPKSVSLKWYNVLSFKFMQSDTTDSNQKQFDATKDTTPVASPETQKVFWQFLSKLTGKIHLCKIKFL